MSTSQRYQTLLSGINNLFILAVLLPFYLATLQTTPNGSEHYFMIDVGETQIVLNTWGTLHATGYPLYVMSGNVIVTLLRALGVSPAAAPALVSLLWGLLALGVVYSLQSSVLSPQSVVTRAEDSVLRTHPSSLIPRRFLPALLATILFGLTRTVWMHMVIAEVYSFGLLILALLLAVALWPRPIRGRIYWLALIGGVGAFHHRALLMAAPALLYAVWPEIVNSRQSTVYSLQSTVHSPENSSLIPHPSSLNTQSSVLSPQSFKHVLLRLLLCLLIGLLGFLPYVYLPLRAQAEAKWVYGQPGTWGGFWDQFFGREASRFIGPPRSLDALAANFSTVNTVLLTDLTAPGLIAGFFGLLLALRKPALRRAAITLIISGLTAYVFHILLYSDILSALILPVTLSVACGWAFLMEAVGEKSSVLNPMGILIAAVILGAALVQQNLPFITSLTKDSTWQDTLALAREAPPDSTLMLAWGPRYFTAAFEQDVMGQLPNVRLVDHRADFAAILNSGRLLVTPEYTFYNQPVSWWEDNIGARIYLNAAAPRLVQIKTQPETTTSPPDGITALSRQVECTPDTIEVRVAWVTARQPARDLSVFVHLLDADGNVIAQGDEAAPVYGWRPLTTWEAGEVVHDVYVLPRRGDAAKVRYGLYYQAASGEFVNEVEYELPVQCP